MIVPITARGLLDLVPGFQDPAGVRWRVDWFYLPGKVPSLKDFGDADQDETVEFLADLCELIHDQFPRLNAREARRAPGYSRRLDVWRLPQQGQEFEEHFEAHAFEQARARDELDDDKLASFHSKMTTKVCRYAPPSTTSSRHGRWHRS